MTSSAALMPVSVAEKYSFSSARLSVTYCSCSASSTSQRCRSVSRSTSKACTLARSLLAILANVPRLSRWMSCTCGGRAALRRFWERLLGALLRFVVLARARRKGRRRVGMNLVVGSSSWVRSMTLLAAGCSVFARFGEEDKRSMTSAFRFFVARDPKATLFVPVVGGCAERC